MQETRKQDVMAVAAILLLRGLRFSKDYKPILNTAITPITFLFIADLLLL